MPKRLQLRELNAVEEAEIRRLAASRREAARLVQRARVIVILLDAPHLSAAEAGQQAGYTNDFSGRLWVRRFNEQGVAGLADEPRTGRPARHTEAVRSALLNLAVQKPSTLGYPFALWTVERLRQAFMERHQLTLARSTIWEWLAAEGLDWKRQQSWFHEAERHDPQFVEKRGP